MCRSFYAILITTNTWGIYCPSWAQSSWGHIVTGLCGVGMPRQTARLHPHSTATVMERDPPWRLLNTAATYLVHIPTYLGTVSIIRTIISTTFKAVSASASANISCFNNWPGACCKGTFLGSMDGVVVRTLASHQCGPIRFQLGAISCKLIPNWTRNRVIIHTY